MGRFVLVNFGDINHVVHYVFHVLKSYFGVVLFLATLWVLTAAWRCFARNILPA